MENKNTTYSIIIGIILLALIGIGIYSFVHKSGSTATVSPSPSAAATGDNSVVVEDQFPGTSAYISSLTLSKPGFVAVFADNAGAPGKYLGSAYFQAGTEPGLVPLSEAMLNSSTYWAVLYSDNGDGTFDQATDTAVKDAAGNVIMKSFKASNNIPEQKG